MKSILMLSIFLLNICSVYSSDSTVISQKIPSSQLKTLDGKIVNILDFLDTNQVTIIFVWETTCKPSIKGLDNILDLYDDWQNKYNCQLLAISIDDYRNNSKIKPFVDGRGWNFTILNDENMDFSRAINVESCPYLIIVNKSGNVVYRHFGYVEGMEYELEDELIKLN
jgi:peroxiredoxin